MKTNSYINRYQNRKIARLEMPRPDSAIRKTEETIYADTFTGNLIFSIPFPLTSCRNLDLSLNLSYHSGGGNGVFGMGFSLDIPCITRKNDSGIPHYDETDLFLSMEHGELVEVGEREEDGKRVTMFRARYEGRFSEICLIRKEGSSYFRIREKDNTVKYYGRSREGRIEHPQRPGEIFRWFLTESEDNCGNKVKYHYEQTGGNCYISRIDYGNDRDGQGKEDWCFGIGFSYEKNRADLCQSCRSGFRCVTDRLCTKISMIHRFEGEQTVRRMEFDYCREGVSLLQEIRLVGIRQEGEGEFTEAYPPIVLSYGGSDTWQPVSTQLLPDGKPWNLRPEQISFIDLYAEGIAGILCRQEGAAVYFPPKGNGQYGRPELLAAFPTEMDGRYGMCHPVSLEGNGAYDFVVLEPGHTGYYAQENGIFQPFADFVSIPFPMQGEHIFWVDTQGDKRQHLFAIDGESGYYYPSLGRKGFASPRRHLLPAGFTVGTVDEVGQKELFADVFGDGLQHRVRIENGRITCWPCMGYGVYGEAVFLQEVPAFSDFDARRVYLADLDGTGTEDYIYLCGDGVKIYRNLGGAFEKKGSRISLPAYVTLADTVYFADLDGTGCKSMILMKADTQQVYSCHFCGGEKPYLLNAVDANLGIDFNITYRTLADRFMEERKKGTEWKNRPWLSVQTVDSICCHDRITGRKQIYEFVCREARYDLEEAVFQGFGEIEVWSWEKREIDDGVEDACIEGVYQKCWNYISGTQELGQPGQTDFIQPAWEGPYDGMPPEAEKALTGALLREERYGFSPNKDKKDEKKLYQITQYGYEVKELQPPQPERRGVYFTAQREQLCFLCEGGGTEDARIYQEAEWERDAYGYAAKSVSAWYRRHSPASREQGETVMLLTERSVSHQTDTSYLLGILLSEEEKEIRCQEELLSFQELCRFVENAEKTKRRREEFFYWDDARQGSLSPGLTGERALLHHSRSFAFPEGFLAGFSEEVTEEKETELCREAGLIRDAEGWWRVSPVTVYLRADGYDLPEMLTSLEMSEESYFCTKISYDAWHLFAVREDCYAGDQVWNRIQAQPDYQAMQYRQVEDWNGNVQEALYTPLGDLMAVTEYGTEQGQETGNRPLEEYIRPAGISREEVCGKPELFLQGASAFYWTDWMSWKREKKPVCRVEAVGMQYTRDKEQTASRPVLLQVHYYDGNLRLIETQAKGRQRWTAYGRVRYGFHGERILRYSPEFLSEAGFSDPNTARIREKMWYDVQGRNVKLCRLKGEDPTKSRVCTIFRKSEYSAWQEIHYDENDTVNDSEYGMAWNGYKPGSSWEEASVRVLERSRALSDTPVCKGYDSMGRPVREFVEREEGTGYALSERDIYGRIVRVGDPRLEAAGKENLLVYRDHAGNAVIYESADAGTRLFLYNIYGNLVFSADKAGHRVHFQYDALQRLTEERVEDAGWTKRICYGDGLLEAKKNNLIGQPVSCCDQAGEETCDSYTMAGKAMKTVRRFWKDYAADTAEHAAAGGPEQDAWTEEVTYNGLGMPVSRRMPDGSMIFWQYDEMGRVCAMSCEKSGERKTDVWKRIAYGADGRMRETEYGNGVKLKAEIAEDTGELHAVSVDGPAGECLLNVRYFCDMAGNVSMICEGEEPEARWEYIYDPFYQLVECRGREENESGEFETYEERFHYDGSGNLISRYHESPSTQFEQEYPVCKDSSRLLDPQIIYNENGEMLESGHFLKLGWDHEGNLKEVRTTIEGKQQVEEYYCYDYRGERIRKVAKLENGEIEEKRYFDGYEEKVVFHAQGEECFRRKTLRIQGGVMAEAHFDCWGRDDEERESKEVSIWKETYCVDDHRQSVVLELDENGEEISREEYDAFGESTLYQRKEGHGAEKEYRFGGKEKDKYTQLSYFGSRYYDGIRFLRADEIDYLRTDRFTGMNLYSYCRNNPVTYLDPLGHCIHYFAAPEFFNEMDRNVKLLSQQFLADYKAGADQNITVIPHKISSVEQFENEWNVMEDHPGTIVIIQAHGNSNLLQMGIGQELTRLGKRSKVGPKQNVRSVILLSCHAAFRQDWGIAGRMLDRISPQGIVIAANASVKYNRQNPGNRGLEYITEFNQMDGCSFYAIDKSEGMKTGRKIGNTIHIGTKVQEIRRGELSVMNKGKPVFIQYPCLCDLTEQWRAENRQTIINERNGISRPAAHNALPALTNLQRRTNQAGVHQAQTRTSHIPLPRLH